LRLITDAALHVYEARELAGFASIQNDDIVRRKAAATLAISEQVDSELPFFVS
jgi:hypothetical protein